MVSVGRPATPSQPGSPGEGTQPESLRQNRGKLCSSSALPSLAGEGMGGGWEKGGWEKQPGSASAQSPGTDMLFLQSGTSGSIPRHRLTSAKLPLFPARRPAPRPPVPGKDILHTGEELGVKAPGPQKEA